MIKRQGRKMLGFYCDRNHIECEGTASSVHLDKSHRPRAQVHGGLRLDHGAQLPDVWAAAERRHQRRIRGHADAPDAGALLGSRRQVQGAQVHDLLYQVKAQSQGKSPRLCSEFQHSVTDWNLCRWPHLATCLREHSLATLEPCGWLGMLQSLTPAPAGFLWSAPCSLALASSAWSSAGCPAWCDGTSQQSS